MVADMISARSLCCNCCVLLITGVMPAGAFAQVLPDPTRPPDAIFTPVDQQARRDSGLQSVIISPTRRTAIINGQAVEQGGMLGDSRLVEVNEGYVVLRSAEGKQVLSMFEGVELKPAASVSTTVNPTVHKLKKKKSVEERGHKVKPPTRDGGEGK